MIPSCSHTETALVVVRGGGHNIVGNAVCDGGLLIDALHSPRPEPADNLISADVATAAYPDR
jgi:FAD/FMN-containing dehydrogenase